MRDKIKIIDAYITKEFIQMVIFGLVAFILIFILVDLMENLDDFIDQRVSASIILKYYFYFAPEIIKLTLPVAVLLSCLFTTGRMLSMLRSRLLSLEQQVDKTMTTLSFYRRMDFLS